MHPVEVGVLGPLELRVAGRTVAITGPRQRSLVAMLALHANRVVPVDGLVEAVWGDTPPDGADHTLQQHVSAVRKALAPDGRASAATSQLSTQSPGYVLAVAALDAEAFERSAATGFDAAANEQWAAAVAAFDGALACWRGAALADTRETPKLRAAAVRLDEQRLGVIERRFDALLAAGQARAVVAELEHVVAEHPLREAFRAQLMLALYRSGRQADALAAYRAARDVLIDELGIEPGQALRSLEQAILEQRADLDVAPAVPADREIYATWRADLHASGGHVRLPDGQSVMLAEGVTLIGRDNDAQVRLVDNRVSRHHAQIESMLGRAVLRDLVSTNGTAVNGEPIEERVLADGDVISVGGVELRFHRAPA
ncbi:MAG TPA: BTAD domain-containing putative transcriptional regulator [Acidimicrobiia bacterium]|nr:BTAD domain-containing putative transcriptional regulator [Acidimicrobiia bacterium]